MSKGFLESLCEISHLSCLQSQSELQYRVRVNFSKGVGGNFSKTGCVVFVYGGGVRDNNTACTEADAVCQVGLDFKLCLIKSAIHRVSQMNYWLWSLCACKPACHRHE